MTLPPRRSAFTTSTLATGTRFPLRPDPNRVMPSSVRIRRTGMPLVAGGQDVAQGEGLIGHNAVDAQVEQLFHGRSVVDGPGVDLQAQRLGPADEGLRGHRDG